MAAAIIIAVGIADALAVEALSHFINTHLSVKCVSAELPDAGRHGAGRRWHGVHIPVSHLYFAIAFSVGVEILNLMATQRRREARPRSPITQSITVMGWFSRTSA